MWIFNIIESFIIFLKILIFIYLRKFINRESYEIIFFFSGNINDCMCGIYYDVNFCLLVIIIRTGCENIYSEKEE